MSLYCTRYHGTVVCMCDEEIIKKKKIIIEKKIKKDTLLCYDDVHERINGNINIIIHKQEELNKTTREKKPLERWLHKSILNAY